jgi:AcrR family transcriptional regulator
MSKSNTTKKMITDHALQLFNRKGIDNAGVREIAKNLGLRVGNITYYFPTKDDLVAELSASLAVLNSNVRRAVDKLTLTGFLQTYRQIFENHYRYRCLFAGYLQLFERNPKVKKQYTRTQQMRFTTLTGNIRELMDNGRLKKSITEAELHMIVSSLALTTRFWLPESRLSYRNYSKEQLFGHYLSLVAHLLTPYATATGKNEIRVFLRSLSG